MTVEFLQKLLKEGEGFTIEFKECVNALNNSVFETVCAFSNRYGGHLLLGVRDDGAVLGVNPASIDGIKKNFINMLSNPQTITPTLFLSLSEIEYDGRIVLYVYVPVSSQVELLAGRLFDRNGDADVNITNAGDLAAQLIARKTGMFSERKVFKYVTPNELRLDLMPLVKQLALSRNEKHPWGKMSDMDILKSAGLYEEDWNTGEKGFNLAGILLFGRDDVIQSCAAGAVTDCLLRRDDLDRYDDRLIVETNLIEAYDRIFEFIEKHTLDRFFLIDGLSVSVRSRIAREIVSNSLAHREYTSSYRSRIVIERDRIVTDNWSRAQFLGPLDPDNFTPRSKNPIIAKFFVNIGRADELGSGVRNLYRYTRIYTGGAEPELIEGDVFKTIVPLVGDKSDKVGDMGDILGDMGDILTRSEQEFLQALLPHLLENEWVDNATAREVSSKSPTSVNRYMARLTELGILTASGENKGRRYQLPKKYRA